MQIRYVEYFDDIREKGPHPTLAFNDRDIGEFHETHHQPILRALVNEQLFGLRPCVAVISISCVRSDGPHQLEPGGNVHLLHMKSGMKILAENAVQFWVTDEDKRMLMHFVGRCPLEPLRTWAAEGEKVFGERLRERLLKSILNQENALIDKVGEIVKSLKSVHEEQVTYAQLARGLQPYHS